MKFLRQLTAVVLAVAVIIGLGMLWAHASGGGGGIRLAPSGEALPRLRQLKGGMINAPSDNGLHLADTGNLIRTCMVEALLATVVISASAARLRRRRMRRSAAARA